LMFTVPFTRSYYLKPSQSSEQLLLGPPRCHSVVSQAVCLLTTFINIHPLSITIT